MRAGTFNELPITVPLCAASLGTGARGQGLGAQGLPTHPLTDSPIDRTHVLESPRQPGWVRRFGQVAALTYLLATGACGGKQKQVPTKVAPPLQAVSPLATQKVASQPTQQPTPTVKAPQVNAKASATTPARSANAVRLASDVTVAELFQLRQDAKIKYIFILFHASWCKPCRVIKTPEYQTKIKAFNRTHPEIRVVSIKIGDKNDPGMKPFKKMLAGVRIFLPSVLNVQNRDGRAYLGMLWTASLELKDPARMLPDLDRSRLEPKDAIKLPTHLVSQ